MLLSMVILLVGTLLVEGSTLERNERSSEVTTTGEVTYIEVLRGRDGRDGRDGEDGEKGETGEKGEPGIQGPPGPPGPTSGGVVHTRWGRTTCPDTHGTELLYQGITAGNHFTHQGGGVNYLCLPEEPEYSDYNSGVQGLNYLYGAEYETSSPIPSRANHNAPCAVCYVPTRETVLMLPARLTCPTNWTLEYNGYLMSEHYNHPRSSTFECFGKSSEYVPGTSADTNGALFYHNEAHCGTGIPCPPYDAQKEITCAVCSK